MKTSDRQHNTVKRRNIIIVFIKAFSIFLWGLLCWFIALLYRNSKKNPVAASGIFIFLVLFGIVSYNALFSQSGQHTAPFFETRSNLQQDVEPVANAASDVPAEANQSASNQASAVPLDANLSSQAAVSENSSQQTPIITQTVETSVPTTQPVASVEVISPAFALPVGSKVPIPVIMSEGRGQTSQTTTVSKVSQDLMRVQQQMANAGFYDGPIDGLDGPKTRAAISKWEKRNGSQGQVQTTAMNNRASTDAMATNSITRSPVQSVSTSQNSSQADTFRVQTGLRLFGYNKVTISGVEDEPTRNALKSFQKMFSLPQTGRVTPEVIAKMKEVGIFE